MTDTYNAITNTLDTLSTEQKKDAVVQAIGTFNKDDQSEIAVRAGLGAPDRVSTNMIWLIIITAFTIILVVSTCSLVYGVVFLQRTADNVQVVLTIFTSVVGFLAGLLSPSPMQKSPK
jgi:hypothetical protein